MDPLSRRTRIIYLSIFALLFVVTIPLAILYASGYKLSGLSTFSFVPTGGIYVTVPLSDALVSINGKEEGTTSLFTKSFYVSNLAPGSYAVHVARESSYPWYRTLIVEPGIVTDVRALLAPQQIEPVKLIRGGAASSTASTTRGIARANYDAYLALFQPATTTKGTVLVGGKRFATSSEGVFGPAPDDAQGGQELYIEGGTVRLHWAKSTSTIPSTFCMKPSSCAKDMFVKKGKEQVVSAQFWGGGVAYSTSESGVYLAEADVRQTPLIIPLYARRGADFRIANGTLIIKDGTSLYQIDGF